MVNKREIMKMPNICSEERFKNPGFRKNKKRKIANIKNNQVRPLTISGGQILSNLAAL